MKQLIMTADELQDKLNDAFDLGYQACLNYKGLTWEEAEELQRYRENAEPVKHGRWIFDNYTKRFRCSECETYKPYDVFADTIDYWDCNYCPNCGAKMQGGADEQS